MGDLTDAQLAEIRNSVVRGIMADQAAGKLPRLNPNEVQAEADALMLRVAATRGWTVTHGEVLGLRIGDSRTQVLEKLKVIGAESVYGDRPEDRFASTEAELNRISTQSEYVMHPSSIRIRLDGDRVRSVVVPPAGENFRYRKELRGATTRAEVMAVFRKTLATPNDEELIERVDPEPNVVDIRKGTSVSEGGLDHSSVWLTDARDRSRHRWQIALSFDAAGLLASIRGVSAQ
jgi:hypothetical protein